MNGIYSMLTLVSVMADNLLPICRTPQGSPAAATTADTVKEDVLSPTASGGEQDALSPTASDGEQDTGAADVLPRCVDPDD